MSLDMKTKIFSRDEINAFVTGFRLLDATPPEIPRDWTIHVGPTTIAKLKFEGPIGADEWDALLAHIAFYKQWYKDKPTTPILNLDDAMEEIHKRLAAPDDDAAV